MQRAHDNPGEYARVRASCPAEFDDLYAKARRRRPLGDTPVDSPRPPW